MEHCTRSTFTRFWNVFRSCNDQSLISQDILLTINVVQDQIWSSSFTMFYDENDAVNWSHRMIHKIHLPLSLTIFFYIYWYWFLNCVHFRYMLVVLSIHFSFHLSTYLYLHIFLTLKLPIVNTNLFLRKPAKITGL